MEPIHPGEVLAEEYLKPLEIDVRQAAEAMAVPGRRLREIVDGRRAITPDIALRLGRFLQNSPLFWLGLQARFDVAVEREKLGERLLDEVAIGVTDPERAEIPG
jgi:addiction module HigA family antidote